MTENVCLNSGAISVATTCEFACSIVWVDMQIVTPLYRTLPRFWYYSTKLLDLCKSRIFYPREHSISCFASAE